ncbi:MAG: Rcs stress response system protein RcsF [Symbiopectobacterium sp.]|uniref:Rcs stress response system protein RcsF n=1 Tax=Symbiopectobacterium sp. TaxID=2952789 RepID=UPI003F394468
MSRNGLSTNSFALLYSTAVAGRGAGQVVSGVAGCYRQAICEGTALKISSQ